MTKMDLNWKVVPSCYFSENERGDSIGCISLICIVLDYQASVHFWLMVLFMFILWGTRQLRNMYPLSMYLQTFEEERISLPCSLDAMHEPCQQILENSFVLLFEAPESRKLHRWNDTNMSPTEFYICIKDTDKAF